MSALFQPITFASGLELKNRLVVAPMTTYSSQPNGVIAADELPYIRRRAEAGYGSFITSACCVHPSGWAFHGQWQCSSDEFLDSLASVADAIHAGGSKAILQIHHGGRQCPPELVNGTPVSASAIPNARPNSAVPRALEEDEILEIIDSFAQATIRAKQTGYDGVQIHGANTYLLQQFVSPHSNRREDSWGQDRLKFPLAVTDAVLNAVPGYSVGYRFSPEEPETPGIRISDTIALVNALCERPLDNLDISLRDFRQPSLHSSYEGSTLEKILEVIDHRLPLIAVGSVKSREDVEAVLSTGADLVAVARVAISEPEWPLKIESGEPIRTKVVAKNMREVLTLPNGLATKIEQVPGWFEVEESEE